MGLELRWLFAARVEKKALAVLRIDGSSSDRMHMASLAMCPLTFIMSLSTRWERTERERLRTSEGKRRRGGEGKG